jgi:hypothetical protein
MMFQPGPSNVDDEIDYIPSNRHPDGEDVEGLELMMRGYFEEKFVFLAQYSHYRELGLVSQWPAAEPALLPPEQPSQGQPSLPEQPLAPERLPAPHMQHLPYISWKLPYLPTGPEGLPALSETLYRQYMFWLQENTDIPAPVPGPD